MFSGFPSAASKLGCIEGIGNWNHSRYQSRRLDCAIPIWMWKILCAQFESVAVVEGNRLLNCGYQKESRLRSPSVPRFTRMYVLGLVRGSV